jgi:hypothetical protein
VDVIERDANDSAAAVRLFSNQLVAELIVLQELVADCRNTGLLVSPGIRLEESRV